MTDQTVKASKEAYAYTPGLKVKHSTTVSKVRRLPISGEVFSNVGDIVGHDTVVARTQVSGDPEIVKAAMNLELDPEEFPRFIHSRSDAFTHDKSP